VFSTNIVNHGGHRGNAMQALARWRHPLASSEARDVFHRAMRPVSYQSKIASDSPVIVDSVSPTTIDK
jgi:hypothetical protein